MIVSFWVVVAIIVIALVLATAEYFMWRRKVADRDRMMGEWAETEERIQAVLSTSGREQTIRDVVLKAKAQQAVLDHLCKITASSLLAPAAVITVVEINGQRWLAHYGAEWCPENVRQGLIAPLETSYCKYVVTSDETLIIVDSLMDIRVRHDDEVTRHAVRAYIGAPVHTADGVPVGSLCVFDTKPRKWSMRDRKTVEAFASLVQL